MDFTDNSESNLLKRMKDLITTLNEASRIYYNENTEILSNLEFDALYDELLSLEELTGITMTDSPTQKVGYEVQSSLQKVSHDSPMLSLDKTKEISKLQSFLDNQTGLISWKLDGLTIVLLYKNGFLTRAVTRGNGITGEDVTHNARVFKNLPLKIKHQGDLVLRGEAVIETDDFERINSTLSTEEKYKNPRNLCSGTVRQLNSEIVEKRNVRLYLFQLISADNIDFKDQKSVQMHWLQEIGFKTVEQMLVDSKNIENVVSDLTKKNLQNKFASDGLVLTYNSISYSELLGSTSKFPKDSIAFKWADEKVETTLEDIQWNTSRTGLINPVAIFKPVEIEGTTVNKASLHNVSVLQSLELGMGDLITVYKANMIIPQVAENLTRSNTAKIPNNCPVCGGSTEIIGEKDCKTLYCKNPNCIAQLVRGLTHFASRDAMNIEGLSKQTIETFVENNFLENYTDIFSINTFEKEILSLKGFGEKSYYNLLDSIEKSKDTALPNFIYALGIKQVGLSNAKLLCGYYDNNLKTIIHANKKDLTDIDGFGEIIAQSVAEYFSDKNNIALLQKVLPFLHFKQNTAITKNFQSEQEDNIFSDKIFVITGSLTKFKNRKELQQLIESLGGKVTGSVSSKTNFLINNDSQSSSAKNTKARELNIPILTEEDFITKFQLKEEFYE